MKLAEVKENITKVFRGAEVAEDYNNEGWSCSVSVNGVSVKSKRLLTNDYPDQMLPQMTDKLRFALRGKGLPLHQETAQDGDMG